jgi:hypothetical protein
VSHAFVPLLAFAVIFAGALVGFVLQRKLPAHHLSSESKDTIKLAAGLIATLSAMVLGLLISSSATTFRSASDGITSSAAEAILLDRLFTAYGPETNQLRRDLRTSVRNAIAVIERGHADAGGVNDPAERGDLIVGLVDRTRLLQPQTDLQKSLLPRGVELAQDLLEAHWRLLEGNADQLPVALLTVLLLWLVILTMTYGLFARCNATLLVILFVCSMSLAGAIFLIEEMSHPLEGLVRVSTAPLENALVRMGDVAP